MPKLLMPLMPTHGGYSGIFKWIERISRVLPETAPEGWTVQYLMLKGTRRLFPDLDEARCIDVPATYADPVRNAAWHTVQLPRIIHQVGADALLLPAGNRRLCPFSPVPVTVVIHDLNELETKGRWARVRGMYGRQVLGRTLGKARSVVAVSSHTAGQLRRIGIPGNRIRVVRNGVDQERFSRPTEAQVRDLLAPLRLKPGFLLYVSRIEHPAKNHRNLLDAYALLRRRCPDTPPLVLAGKDWDGAEVVHRRAEQPDVREHVRFTGYIADEVMPALYAGARALVFPSLAEGFGLPLLEAMAAGCPVLCSDRTPMNEIVGDAGYCFEPEYPEDIAEGLKQAICDDEWRQGLIARGHQRVLRFTWTVTAQSLWRLIA